MLVVLAAAVASSPYFCVRLQAGFLAQKRLARGVRLNYAEATALLATQVIDSFTIVATYRPEAKPLAFLQALEFIRDGKTVAELMDIGRRLLGRRHVMPGVASLIGEVQVREEADMRAREVKCLCRPLTSLPVQA